MLLREISNVSGIAYLLSEGEGSLVVVQRRVQLAL